MRLAEAYIWADRLDDAIRVYRQILEIDNTVAEAWQGLGKMYYWKNKPITALKYYRKALQLDPESPVIKREYEDVRRDAAFYAGTSLNGIYEGEQNYQIEALSHRIWTGKRVLDSWAVEIGNHLDISDRHYYNNALNDTVRPFQALWLKSSIIGEKNQLDLFGGYSITDDKFTTYGLQWKWVKPVHKWKLTNRLGALYDYYYYWNEIGHHKVEESFQADYRRLRLQAHAQAGITDKAYIMDVPNDRYTDDYNPFYGFGFSASYVVWKKTNLRLGATYSYLTYTYKSNRYYSPLGRNLFGPEMMLYYPMGHFYIYGFGGLHYGYEYYYERRQNQGQGQGQGATSSTLQKVYINSNNWTASFETGYHWKNWDFSVSAGRFYNAYYQNFNIMGTAKYVF